MKNLAMFDKKVYFSLLQEVLVSFIGFGPDEDEWVNVKTAVRERSISLENSECNLIKVGEYVLCFQVLSLPVGMI